MAYRIIWSAAAIADLRDLVRYIARDNGDAARKFGDLIVSKVESIGAFPRIAKMVPEYRVDSLREIIVSPYRIVFEIDDEAGTLTVLRIWHGARESLEMPED